ncbi:MAG: type II toxin-antitoxin system VapC family toxin, partial [Candidatus Rokubacteria bacterium]|nr:type II toxin-antitoxin system VapC family toxin [Candidatus Rokubacteria bacterium]
GPATRFLAAVQDEELGISVHVACELFAGAELSPRPAQERERVRELCDALQIVYPDERFAEVYGRLLAWQERHHQRIAVMDLLIATAALVEGAPLATRNVRDFSRVPGLDLARY